MRGGALRWGLPAHSSQNTQISKTIIADNNVLGMIWIELGRNDEMNTIAQGPFLTDGIEFPQKELCCWRGWRCKHLIYQDEYPYCKYLPDERPELRKGCGTHVAGMDPKCGLPPSKVSVVYN